MRCGTTPWRVPAPVAAALADGGLHLARYALVLVNSPQPHESAGLVEGVPAHRRDDTPAATLLLDPSNVRKLVSMAASAQFGGRPRRPIEWSDYISEVVDPNDADTQAR